MSRGTDFLMFVTAKLKQRIGEVKTAIEDVQKDIEGMNEYYWDNYTEMDQYGYENYDNQQALLAQVKAKQESQSFRRRLKKMLDSPFFGSVDFIYDGEDEAERFYIGIANFSESRGGVPLIYDWRAPVSGLFYDFDKGAASYEAPGGTMNGKISSKWQYKIRGGQMIYEVESDTKIDDDILKQELASGGDAQLKNIVRTIQKEQNAIIRNTKDRILVIQGVAGSGKTSVALHRIAYLLYHDREHLSSSDILVLTPNGAFSDYISHVLPELGEENIQEMSFDVFAYHELSGIVSDCEDRCGYMERQMRLGSMGAEAAGESRRGGAQREGQEHPGAAGAQRDGQMYTDTDSARKRFLWKQSRSFTTALEGFLAGLEDRLVDFKDVEYRGMEMTEQELLKLFYYKFPDVPLLSRMDEVYDYFADAYETLKGCTLEEEDAQKLRARFLRMYVTTDVYVIYNWFLGENGWPVLPDVPPEKRVLDYEDVYPLLYLKYRLYQPGKRRKIKHLVIDEMQDYSWLQYVILERLFSCSMTILGDRAQTLDVCQQDVTRFLPKIFGRGVKMLELNKSYRNTAEISEYAARLTGVQEQEYLRRHGRPVEERAFGTMEEALQAVCQEVRYAAASGERSNGTEISGDRTGSTEISEEHTDSTEISGECTDGTGISGNRTGSTENAMCVYETVAVLTMTEREALEAYTYLKERCADVSYIDRDSTSFRKGITVTTFYMAKGLEFDQVFVVGGDRSNAYYKQFQYICATRALHELSVFSVEKT